MAEERNDRDVRRNRRHSIRLITMETSTFLCSLDGEDAGCQRVFKVECVFNTSRTHDGDGTTASSRRNMSSRRQ
jgi:hypothetical protein